MRAFFCALILTCAVAGCHSSNAKPATSAEASPGQSANTKICTLRAGGVDVLKLTVPANLRSESGDGVLKLYGPQYNLEVWLVRDARTLDQAIARVGPQIVDEFKDFKPGRTSDLTIAGAPAKRLVGTGREADDGDPGEADVIVFKAGDHLFVACDHGEDLTPVGQQGLLSLVQTAQRP